MYSLHEKFVPHKTGWVLVITKGGREKEEGKGTRRVLRKGEKAEKREEMAEEMDEKYGEKQQERNKKTYGNESKVRNNQISVP